MTLCAYIVQRQKEDEQLKAQYQRKLTEEREQTQARFELDKSRWSELQRRFDEQTGRRKRP
jgi:hypothetical protein